MGIYWLALSIVGLNTLINGVDFATQTTLVAIAGDIASMDTNVADLASCVTANVMQVNTISGFGTETTLDLIKTAVEGTLSVIPFAFGTETTLADIKTAVEGTLSVNTISVFGTETTLDLIYLPFRV